MAHRTREEIQDESIENIKSAGAHYPHGAAILEVLLDIRDLLTHETTDFVCNDPKCYPCVQAKKEDNNN